MTDRLNSLDHVPRRGVAMAKELRRMGLDVVQAGRSTSDKESEMSANDINQVAETAKLIEEVGERARKVNESLKAHISDIHDGLGIAEDVDGSLGKAAASLRGAFGRQTNAPPKSGEGDAGAGGAPAPGGTDGTG